MMGGLVGDARKRLAEQQLQAGETAATSSRITELEAAVDRVRRRHPRGDEEASPLSPGLWCPTCGHERTDNGFGACPDRLALEQPKNPDHPLSIQETR